MKKDRYMLIHMDEEIRRFADVEQAKSFAQCHCRGSYEFYVIVDTEDDRVVNKWSY